MHAMAFGLGHQARYFERAKNCCQEGSGILAKDEYSPRSNFFPSTSMPVILNISSNSILDSREAIVSIWECGNRGNSHGPQALNRIIMVSTVDIPFEIWHPILRDVYSDISVFPHLEDPCYVLSPLHQRLLVHRNISLVSKHLHELSSAVFPEDLHIYHPEALLAVSRLVTKYPNIARVIRKLWFNFYEYRCGASSPRRPRTMKGPLAEVPIPPDADPVAQAEARLRRSLEQRRRVALLRYSPSVTNQPRHWQGWIGLTRTILARCKGVSEVSIDATADYSQHFRRPNARDYRTL